MKARGRAGPAPARIRRAARRTVWLAGGRERANERAGEHGRCHAQGLGEFGRPGDDGAFEVLLGCRVEQDDDALVRAQYPACDFEEVQNVMPVMGPLGSWPSTRPRTPKPTAAWASPKKTAST